MNDVSARYEFRAFAQSFGIVEDTIRRLAPCEQIRESREVYLVRHDGLDRNIKIRDGNLELKQLIDQRDGLEQWRPSGKFSFPVLAEEVRSAIPTLAEHLEQSQYDQGQLLRHVAVLRCQWFRVNVFKRRFRFQIQDCPTEIDEILINGAAIRSVAVESLDAARLSTVRQLTRVDEYENVSYPRMLARVLGLEPMPDQDRYGGASV